ncbi:restriction endonuclease subunit S [Streptococcus oralis]|jgi:hypothetical protein|uniref:restriction endonuclease subunit S n=1 Tax=Streptococcus oralis TaxID=1303 RepID=UPI002001A83B|nr:restriction endonuclease subunit S [Streptococcus oralis]
MEEELKPKLRFNNFENPWQQSLLMDQVEIRRGLTYKPSDVRSSGVRVLRSSNIVDDTFILSDDDVFVDKGVVNIPKVSNGDILVTAANGSTKLVGKHAILKNLPDDEIVVHGGFMLLFKTEQNYFVNAWMSSNEYKRVLQFVQGGNGAIGNLSSTVLKSMKMSFPSVQEQFAIGSLFRTFDELLASYKDNLANYQSLKSTMLSKMFPKDGQTVPEIRLDGFEGKCWEEKKLIDLVSPVSRKVRKPSVPYYRMSIRSHAKGTFKQYVDDPKKIAMDNLFEVKENDLVVNITFAWEHAIAVASKEDDGLLVSHRFPTFVIDKSDKNFINIYIKREEFRKKMDLLSPGGAGRNRVLNVKDFIKIQMIVPELEEQQAIGAYFSTLDNIIHSHQEKISQLETLKKKLLQDMFI